MSQFLNAEEFFQAVKHLHTFQGVLKHEDIKLLESWLDTVKENFSSEHFTRRDFVKFIKELNFMMRNNKKIYVLVVSYVKLNTSFSDFFLRYTEQNHPDFKKGYLCDILQFCAHVQILPDKMWLNKWFQRTKELLPHFSKMHSYEALEAICILSYSRPHTISTKWMKEWFLNNENHIEEFSLNQFTHILSLVGRMHIEPPSSWIEKCKNRFPELLEEFSDRKVIGVNILFLFADAFNISEIRKDVKIVSLWLEKSLDAMKDVNASYAIGSLLSLAHTDVLVSLKWIDLCLEKVISEIDFSYERSVVLKNVANALYSLTLMNIERVYCQSFLEKCNVFFKKVEKKVFSDNEHLLFRKVIFSKNYFELFGFTLCVTA